MPESLRSTLDYLRELHVNNNKKWFDLNHAHYDKARGAFEDFIVDLIASFDPIEDFSGVTAKECMFRINRDIRFSPDKTPYKISMSAVIGRGGRKATGRSYYIHIQPDGNSLLAGGLYSPSPAELDKVRSSIAEDSSKLKAILHKRDFVRYFGTISGDALKTAPKGYPKDHPDLELLRLKQFVAHRPLTDEQVLSDDLIPSILEASKALKPFLSYIEAALGR